MKILVAGAGPTGLMFAFTAGDEHEITVLDTSAANERPGHGITFARAVAESLQLPSVPIDPAATVHLDEEQLNRFVFTPPRAGVARRDLIDLLREGCEDRGIRFEFEVPADEALRRAADYDLVIGADGAGSRVRQHIAAEVGAAVSAHETQYIWLSSAVITDHIRLVGRATSLGGFLLWTYPHGAEQSTVIVQCSRRTAAALAAQRSHAAQLDVLSDVFAHELQGHKMIGSGQERWSHFRCVETRSCSHDKFVLLGDALHTTHFSMGMGTVLALEDAAELAQALDLHPHDWPAALREYEQLRLPEVKSIQRLATYTMGCLDRAISALDAGDRAAAAHPLRECANYANLPAEAETVSL